MDLKRTVIDLMPAPLVRTFAAPYIAGKGIEAGVAKADDLNKRLGLHSTVDLLGDRTQRRDGYGADHRVPAVVELDLGRGVAERPLHRTERELLGKSAFPTVDDRAGAEHRAVAVEREAVAGFVIIGRAV